MLTWKAIAQQKADYNSAKRTEYILNISIWSTPDRDNPSAWYLDADDHTQLPIPGPDPVNSWAVPGKAMRPNGRLLFYHAGVIFHHVRQAILLPTPPYWDCTGARADRGREQRTRNQKGDTSHKIHFTAMCDCTLLLQRPVDFKLFCYKKHHSWKKQPYFLPVVSSQLFHISPTHTFMLPCP